MGKQLEPFYADLGIRVAELRTKLDMSQAKLGSLLRPQMTRASVANIETGQQRVLAHTFVALAKILACDLETLAGSKPVHVPESDLVQRELERKLKNQIPKAVLDELARTLGLQSSRKRR